MQEKIEEWKLKRKEALKQGSKSKVKRLARNIKKSENLLKETFVEVICIILHDFVMPRY